MKEKYTIALVIAFGALIFSGLMVFIFVEGYEEGRNELQKQYDIEIKGRSEALQNAGENKIMLQETFDQMDSDSLILSEIKRINRYIYMCYFLVFSALGMAIYMNRNIILDK